MRSFLATSILLSSCFYILGALGDVGTATYYVAPYLPTKCNGDNQNQFPSNGYFGAVSVALWDNGGACGRKYQIRCISGRFHPCTNRSIVVQIVDFCRKDPCPATMALSKTALGALSRYLSKINVEYILI